MRTPTGSTRVKRGVIAAAMAGLALGSTVLSTAALSTAAGASIKLPSGPASRHRPRAR